MAYNWTTLTAAKTTLGSIANWVNRTDLPTDNILLEAEAKIYERLRVREMQVITTLTVAADENSVSLPSDFLDPIEWRPYGWSQPILFVTEGTLEAHRDDSGALFEGTPSRWSIVGETAYVDVSCSEAFSGKLMYYKRPAALSASNETNFLTIRYPSLVRTACLAAAYEHMKDMQNAATYLQMLEGKIGEAMMTNDLYRRSQTPLYS